MRVLKLVRLLVLGLVLPAAAYAGGADLRASWPQTDFSHANVPLSKITAETGRDHPPAVTKPEFLALQAPSDLGGLEPVVTVEIHGIRRAYPLQILAQHQVINDVIDNVPVAITFCPLRKSAAAFVREAGGHVLELANAGVAYDNNIILYDKDTHSWWQQINGKAIVGQLAGQSLKLIPARLESFAQFKARVPAAEVDQAGVLAPTALSKRPILQTDADNLVIPVDPARADEGKTTAKDRVVVVGSDEWTLSVLQRLGTVPADKDKPMPPAHKDKKGKKEPFKVYYKNGTLQVPYSQDDE